MTCHICKGSLASYSAKYSALELPVHRAVDGRRHEGHDDECDRGAPSTVEMYASGVILLWSSIPIHILLLLLLYSYMYYYINGDVASTSKKMNALSTTCVHAAGRRLGLCRYSFN